MNIVNLIPAVTAYCQERIRELNVDHRVGTLGIFDQARCDEVRRILTLCEGLEKQQTLLTDLVNRPHIPHCEDKDPPSIDGPNAVESDEILGKQHYSA